MPLAGWWSRLTGAECADCGQPLSVFARACKVCGAPNRSRVAALTVAAALAILVIAIVAAIIAVASGKRQSADETVQSQSGSGDFAWLTTAMHACDALAEKEPETLHFLAIPLAVAPNSKEDWRAQALNKLGNAILLRSDVALDGLKQGTLSIAKDGYVFSVRDQAKVVYKWDRTVGVAKFSVPKADSITGFDIQFALTDQQGGDDWGNTFVRQKGNCYWVNAILAK